MSKESTVTPMGGLSWIVKEACTILGLGAGGWFGELMPPPHPTSRTAKKTSNTGAQVKPSPSPQARKRMAQAVEKTLREGLQAKLPPHLSTLLGLSKEEESLVRQGVVRTGKTVQGFDVSTANKNDVVLFVVNEATNDQTLYLASRVGMLREVVTVKAGVGEGRG